MADQEAAKVQSVTGRGPSYPIVSVQDAISKIRKFYDKEGKAAAPVAAAVEHWGYSGKSSGGRQMVSTLLQYGLLRDEGSGAQRRVSLTKPALDILLLEEQSAQWKQAVAEAARSPKLFAEILSQYASSGLPSDTTLKHYLITDKNISPSAVDTVIKNIRANVSYAKLMGSDKVTADALRKASKDADPNPAPPKVGDRIQWESGGVLQFESPRLVRAVTEDNGTVWVFVEGSETGIPASEITVEQVASELPPAARITPPRLPEVAGERELLRGPLSRDTNYRLLINGELGPKELGKLIRLLEAQKLVLSDEEEAD